MAELIVYGIVLGSIIALGSVGLTLMWGITDLFNCAHGDQITAGAYMALPFAFLFSQIGFLQAKVGPFSFTWALVLAFIPAILLSIVLAVLIDRWVYKPLRRSGAHFQHLWNRHENPYHMMKKEKESIPVRRYSRL